MVQSGIGSYIGFGEVATYATNGVNTDMEIWFRVEDDAFGVEQEVDMVEFTQLTSWDELSADHVDGQRRVTGTVTLKPTWEGLQNIFRFLTGHNVTVSGVGPYTYAFVPVGFNDTAHYSHGTTVRHLCIEKNLGNATNSVYYQGCIITQAEFKFDPGQRFTLTLTWIGRRKTKSAKSTPSYGSTPMVVPTGQSTTFLLLGGGTEITKSCTVTINNAMEARYDLTDQEPLIPYPSGQREVTLEVEVEPDTDEDYFDASDAPITNKLSSGSVTLETAGGSDEQLVIAFDELVLTTPSEPQPAGFGPVTQTLTYKAKSSAVGTSAYTITLVNDDTDYAS